MSDGLGASTVRNSLMPLRAIYRQALALDEVAVNPTSGVQLPAVRGKRERIASPTEAEQLIAALQPRDRAAALGRTAGAHGRARRPRCQPDPGPLELGPKEGRVAPKSRSGRRTVPVPAAIRKHLLEHRLARGRRGGLFFSRPDGRPFSNQALSQRAARTWRAADLQADRPPRMPPHLRLADDRRRRQRQGPRPSSVTPP